MKAIGKLFGGGGGVDPEVEKRQRETLALQKENADKIAKREEEEKRKSDARTRLLRATQGAGGTETLYASETGVGGPSKVVG